jgi:hypothetical protein
MEAETSSVQTTAMGPQLRVPKVIEVELRWLAADTLLLRPDPKAAVFKQASIVQGVHIVSGASGRGGA